MKLVLTAVLCAIAVNVVLTMPVAEPGVQSDQLTVVPLEKDTPVLATVLRRETPETAAPAVSEHREGETPEEHAKHAHLIAARLDDKAEKSETVKVEEAKPLGEEVKVAETVAELPEKKDDLIKSEEAEPAIAATAAVADIITPAKTLPLVPAASEPIESKPEAPVAEGKSAPAKKIDSELKKEIKSEEQSLKAVEKIEEPQPLAKSSPIASEPAAPAAVDPVAPVAAAADIETPKEEKKIEAVVAEIEPKSAGEQKEEVKKVEDKTDRVTRGTEEAKPVDAPQPAPVAEVAAAVAEPEQKLTVEKKDEGLGLSEKKIEAIEYAGTVKAEKKPELTSAAEENPIIEASEVAASAAVENLKVAEKKVESSEIKAEEPSTQAKSSSVQLDAQAEAQPSDAAAAPTEVKPEPVVDTIKLKSESIGASKSSAEDSGSSEEKSSEEDQSGEKLEKSAGAKSVDVKKDEAKAEELPKPQEVKEVKKPE